MVTAGQQAPAPGDAPYRGLGERLRARREAAGLSLRALARRIGVSPSLISQIETGKAQPSVSTLYAVVSELGGTVDELLFGDVGAPDATTGDLADAVLAMLSHPPVPAVLRASERRTIQLSDGVRWERLTQRSVPGVEFLHVVYEPGAESAPADGYQRHPGREWAYILSGTLHVSVGFDEHDLGPGDSITYASTTPHRLTNRTEEPVEAIWFLLG